MGKNESQVKNKCAHRHFYCTLITIKNCTLITFSVLFDLARCLQIDATSVL